MSEIIERPFLEGTDEGIELLRSVYPAHIYDQLRRDIAAEIIGKELAKLTGIDGNGELQRIRDFTQDTFEGINVVSSPVHDFWSTFELLPLVKTKRLSQFVTAKNVAWHQEPRDIDQLTLGWMPFIEARPDVFGTGPWPIPVLKAAFEEYPLVLEEAKESNAENVGKYRFEHSDEPITIVQASADEYLLDGNGRLYRALMAGKASVNCSMGVMEGEYPTDYWISSGLLNNLAYEIMNNLESRPEVSEAATTLLRYQLASNEIARINYALWVGKHFPQLDSVLGLESA